MSITAISQFDDALKTTLKAGDTRYVIPFPTTYDWRNFNFINWLRTLSTTVGGENFTSATFHPSGVLLVANKTRFDAGVAAATPAGAEITTAVPVKAVTYSRTIFNETTANTGAITDTSILTIANDYFTGVNGAALPGAVVTNVPAGLTASITRTSAYTAIMRLTGNAAAHAAANNVANLTVTLGDAAFASGLASGVTGATKANLAITFTT